ncbi:MAG: DUF86 domain-containing protein [Acidobacteria bacterium]|nr:DUF86 domain-containing protein [Acidobacteriota bacterium]MBV9476071.1 DUF86 domain-containing protein [Acidobacteriota bacterium]
MLRDAVERRFGMIGEALREAARVDATVPERITRFREIVDFRNVLVYDYATIYDEGVWRIVQNHLPRLLAEVRAVLER